MSLRVLSVSVLNIWPGVSRRPIVPLLVLALLLTPSNAAAARRNGVTRPLAFDSLHGHVGVGYDRRVRSKELPRFGGGFRDFDEQEAIFEEEIAVSARGYVFHPRFLIFDLDGLLTFKQRDEDIEGGRGIDTDSLLQDYNADLTLLQRHPYTLQLFASRANFDVDSVFVARQEVTTDTMGLQLRLKALPFPTRLTLRHTEEDQEGRFRRHEEGVEARVESGFRTSTGHGHLSYGFDDRESTLFDDLTRHRLRFAGSSRLEDQGEASISAGLERQSGALFLQREDVRGDVHWRLTDHVQANTNLHVDKQKRRDREILLLGGRIQLAHQLYESLTTTVTFDGAQESVDETGSDDEVGGDLTFAYRKRIPGGSLALSLNGARSFNREEDLGGLGQVVDEAHTIPQEGFVFLEEPLVELASVVVTDGSGLALFSEGIDYRLDQVGSVVRLTAMATGALVPGQEILIDYTFFGQPDATFITDTWGGGGRLTFHWGLSLFAQHSRASHTLQSGSTIGDRLQTATLSTAGIELNRGPSHTSLRFEERVNRTNPSRRWDANEELHFRPTANLNLALNAGWGVTVLPKEDESFQGITAAGRVEWQPMPVARLKLTALYASQERVDDQIDRVRVEVEASLRHRAIEAILSDRQEFVDSDLSGESSENLLYLKVRRLF